jgi:hypothetical protein
MDDLLDCEEFSSLRVLSVVGCQLSATFGLDDRQPVFGAIYDG